MSRYARFRDLVLPATIIISLIVVMMPLPAAMMDFLLIANISVSIIVLMTAINVKAPLEFNVFPTVLLATVLSRLVLNIATTRLILTKAASNGTESAGGVISSFGEFVAGDQILVGVIIFSIIAVVQFVVITKGATRISEVAARFVLDGMPGRQMAVDADLNAGMIDKSVAKNRRDEITRQADFYGAMDGASKFVRGDAIASIAITVINMIGGLVVGVVHFGMSPVEAVSIFTKLTIGDGLVSQLPALLISLAAGILVTRSTERTNLSATFVNQLFDSPKVLGIAAGFLALLLVTSLPKLPLLMMGTGLAGTALVMSNQRKAESKIDDEKRAQERQSARKPKGETKRLEPRIEEYLTVDPIEVEIGLSLLPLADPKRGGSLLSRITKLRQTIAAELGIVLPRVRIRDNLRVGEDTYRIKINGSSIASAQLPANQILVPLKDGKTDTSRPVIQHPAISQPAVIISSDERDEFESRGIQILDQTAILMAHLERVVHRHAHELLTRDSTRHLIDELKRTSPTVVQELIPNRLSLGQVQRVLQNLLLEQVSIRQLGLILEALEDAVDHHSDTVRLTEHVRRRLARSICERFRNADNRLHVVTLDPKLESRIADATTSDGEPTVRMSSDSRQSICATIGTEMKSLTTMGRTPILLVEASIRPFLRALLHDQIPDAVALSYDEITLETKVVSVGIVGDVRA